MDLTRFEFGSEMKRVGKLKMRAVLLIALYVFFTIGAFTAVFLSGFVPVGAIIPIFVWMLVFLTWRYVQIDNKYFIEAGYLTLYRQYGRAKPKKIASIHLKDAISISPKDMCEHINTLPKKNVLCAIPTPNWKDAYAIIYVNERGVKSALLIDAPKEAVKALYYYNDRTIRN